MWYLSRPTGVVPSDGDAARFLQLNEQLNDWHLNLRPAAAYDPGSRTIQQLRTQNSHTHESTGAGQAVWHLPDDCHGTSVVMDGDGYAKQVYT